MLIETPTTHADKESLLKVKNNICSSVLCAIKEIHSANFSAWVYVLREQTAYYIVVVVANQFTW